MTELWKFDNNFISECSVYVFGDDRNSKPLPTLSATAESREASESPGGRSGAAGVQGAAAPWRGCGGRAPARKNIILGYFPSVNLKGIMLFAAHSDPAKIYCSRLHTPKDVGTTKQQARRAGAPPHSYHRQVAYFIYIQEV